MTVTVRFPLPPQTTESIYLEFDQVTAQQILFKNRALLFLFFTLILLLYKAKLQTLCESHITTK